MSILPSVLGSAIDYNTTHEILSSLSPLTSLPVFVLLLVSLQQGQKFCPDSRKESDAEYDYIVVGAGTAGAVIASRLSEEPCVTVLLLEAGGCPCALTEVPVLAILSVDSYMDWQFRTVRQKHAGKGYENGQMKYPMGKMVGGGSVLNEYKYERGNKRDFDEWAAAGAEGWDYQSVLPYFLKSEGNRDPALAPGEFHNDSGPVTIDRSAYKSEMTDALLEEFKILGYDITDSNGEKQIGVNNYQGTMRDGQRCSTAKAFLVPNENRKNLHIVTGAYVTKVIIEDNTAVGVQFDQPLRRGQVVKARREVILSAGTVKSPHLLLLSGIGPAEQLRSLNIPLVADLPVGSNLQDHIGILMGFENTGSNIKPLEKKISDAGNIYEYYKNRSGVLSSMSAVAAVAYMNPLSSSSSSTVPTIQIEFAEAQSQGVQKVYRYTKQVYEKVWQPYEGKTIAVCVVFVLNPESRGSVTLKSTNPYDQPAIDPNFLDKPGDLTKLVEGLKICQHVGNSEPMRKLHYRPFQTVHPGCENVTEGEYLACVAKLVGGTAYHPVGTCKMGAESDPSTVVDPELRVKHVKNLRVADASVMPKIISGNTCATAMMIGEKAADMIRKGVRCGPKDQR